MGVFSKYLEQPTVDNICERADHLIFEAFAERAVIEAGFATEPLRHCVAEMYECLYIRMLNDPHGFTEKEWRAVTSAKELLGLNG
jgi:hypothetical protein